MVVLGLVPVAVASCSEAGPVVGDDLEHCCRLFGPGQLPVVGVTLPVLRKMRSLWAARRTPNMLLWRIGRVAGRLRVCPLIQVGPICSLDQRKAGVVLVTGCHGWETSKKI